MNLVTLYNEKVEELEKLKQLHEDVDRRFVELGAELRLLDMILTVSEEPQEVTEGDE